MASTASTSQPAPLTTTPLEERPQAGPLPAKVGEIGYQGISEHPQDLEEIDLGDDAPDVGSVEGLDAAQVDARNGRHPADRSHVDLTSPSSISLPVDSVEAQQHQPNTSTTSLNTISKHTIFSFRSFNSKSYRGFSFGSIFRLGVSLFIVCGLICAWVFTAMHLKTPNSQSTSPDSQTLGGNASAIFVHVAFAIVIILLLIFVERIIFRLRAERYAYKHPGEILPMHRSRAGPPAGSTMAFAPWNRPPLPTYAAALGVRGTGDVEDNIIAVPPPPEYGNTRGSTLILASFLRRSRTSNRSRSSAQGRDTQDMVEHPGADGRMSDISARSMPISYAEAEHHGDVERARILEETLAKLEDGNS